MKRLAEPERTVLQMCIRDRNYLMLYLADNYALTSEKKIQNAISIVAENNKSVSYTHLDVYKRQG